MQVVHLGHRWQRYQIAFDSADVEPARGLLDEDPDRLRGELRRARKDEQSDGDGHHRVGVAPAEGERDRAGEQHSHRAQGIGQHLKVGAAHVDALLRPAPQEREHDEVRRQPGSRGEQHGQPRDHRGIDEPLHRLVQDPAGHSEQQQRVAERGEHFEPVEPEGPAGCGARSSGGHDSRQRHAQAEHVGEHVRRVRQQRQ
jgi:hypothetical protein